MKERFGYELGSLRLWPTVAPYFSVRNDFQAFEGARSSFERVRKLPNTWPRFLRISNGNIIRPRSAVDALTKS